METKPPGQSQPQHALTGYGRFHEFDESEVVMQKFFVLLCVMCFVCSQGIAQAPSINAAPQGARPPAQTSAAQKRPSPDVATPSAKPAAQSSTSPTATNDFIIGSEDVLEIRVWHKPDLTTKAVVRPDGKIGMTLLGDIQASGLTTSQLKDAIAAKLERFLDHPEVSVVVVEIHSQTVH
jgi:protein involved in polysaccharide export with SLBB domain